MRCGMVNEVFRKPTSWNWKGDKKRGLGKNRFAIGLEVAYVAVLIIFTMYILLDTFVLSEKITVVDNAQTTSTGKDTTGGTAKSSTGSGSSSSDTRARRSGSSGKITMYLLWQTEKTSENEGLSLHELAEFMEGLGVQTAYNLDGGGSSAMYFNGEIVNQPTTNGHSIEERRVSDIVYIGY